MTYTYAHVNAVLDARVSERIAEEVASTVLPVIAARIDQLSAYVRDGAETQSEIEAQHRSETDAYGDSWPGASEQIRNGRAQLRRDRAELSAALAAQDVVSLAEATIPGSVDSSSLNEYLRLANGPVHGTWAADTATVEPF